MPTNRRLPVTCIRFATERMHSCKSHVADARPLPRCRNAAPSPPARARPPSPPPSHHAAVTQNEGCTPAELIAVFNVPTVGLQFFPYTEVNSSIPDCMHACLSRKVTVNRCFIAHRSCTRPPTTRPTRTPGPQAYLPANTVSSFFGGQLDNNALWKPVGTAPLGETRLWPTFVWVCGVVGIRQVPGRGGACWQLGRIPCKRCVLP